MDNCRIYRLSQDQMRCAQCNVVWDVGDEHPPRQFKVENVTVDKRKLTTAPKRGHQRGQTNRYVSRR